MSSSKSSLSSKIYILVCLLFFLAQTLFFLFTNSEGAPPDEIFHFKQILIFMQTPWAFMGVEDLNAMAGQHAASSFLYHLLLGLIMKLLSASGVGVYDSFLILRGVNILLACISIVLLYKLANLILKNNFLSFVAVVLQINLLMFTYLSSAISYDNLANLLGIASLYSLFAYRASGDHRHAWLVLMFIGLGLVTKITLLPLFVLTLIGLGWSINEKSDLKSLASDFKTRKGKAIALRVLSLASIVFAIIILSKNAILYQDIWVTCDAIYSSEQCVQQNVGFKEYTSHKVQAYTRAIDRNFIEYTGFWYTEILKTTTGIFSHFSYFQSPESFVLILVLSLIPILCLLVNFKKGTSEVYTALLLFMLYAAVLFFHNYQHYLLFRPGSDQFSGIEGRYIFPVLGLLITTLVYFSFATIRKHRVLLASITIVITFLYGFMNYFLWRLPTL